MRVKKVFTHRLIQEKLIRQIVNGASILILAAIIGLMTSADAGACASCGCTLSSNWEDLQYYTMPGLNVDMHWDYLNQDQLRHGTGTISPTAASRFLENGSPAEVEKYTRNNYVTLGVDYNQGPDWGFNVQIPYIDRSHSTLGTASNGITPGPGGGQYNSHTSSIGDVKVIGRYHGFDPQCKLGVLFGVKLPTGSHTETGTSTDPTAHGPVLIDPGLQPGTGSTDVILGAYYNDAINQYWSYFAQALFERHVFTQAGYIPGEGYNFNLGLRYTGISGFRPQMQLNLRHVLRDTGTDPYVDVFDTGGTLLYISPGVVVPVSSRISVYGFVQLPVYQDVRGVQLAPRFTTSVGVRYSLW